MALERADAPSNMLILRNLMLCYQSIMFNYTSMDLRQLQVFHTVMETRSASRAARILGVSQPAVSTLLKRLRSEEHTSELQSLMRISYAVFCLKKTTSTNTINTMCLHTPSADMHTIISPV